MDGIVHRERLAIGPAGAVEHEEERRHGRAGLDEAEEAVGPQGQRQVQQPFGG